ncbi:MAG: elongation factor P hydroxylase [Gammaproteobacteria bacterium]|nr:elongation factor P hydroxylase [Gammaproteobacteria bacterium]
MRRWLNALNDSVLNHYRTRIIGGFAEPFYKAATGDAFAEIRFTHDYERSALHELGHWCVAGEQRREQDDYGYWYAPDGRDSTQQQLFFQVEIKPQAIERHFCSALGIPFAVSVDNLGNPAIEGVTEFGHAVDDCYAGYSGNGLPERASEIYHCLARWKSADPGV